MAGGSNGERPQLAKGYGDDANLIAQKVFEEVDSMPSYSAARSTMLIELAKVYATLDLAQAIREAEVGRRLDNIIDRM